MSDGTIGNSLLHFDNFAHELNVNPQDLIFDTLALDLIRSKFEVIVQQAIASNKTGRKLDDFIQQMLIKNKVDPDTSVYVMHLLRRRIKEKELPQILSKEDAVSSYEGDKNVKWLVFWVIGILLLWSWNPLRLRFWWALIIGLFGGGVGFIGTLMMFAYNIKDHPEHLQQLIEVISEDFLHAVTNQESLDADAKAWKAQLSAPKITVRSSS